MKILAIDSSAGAASVAVTEDKKILSECYINKGLTHSQTLIPMVDFALKNAGMKTQDIDVFAVTNGPGSFTGVRIGVAAIKGLAMGADKPCFGVSTLEAMANSLRLWDDFTICCVMDARCSQFYTATFYCESGSLTRFTPDRAISSQELIEELKEIDGKIVITGDGAELLYNSIKDIIPEAVLAPENLKWQRAYGAAVSAAENKENFVPGEKLEVSYLRLPQAERELKKKKENLK